MPETEKRAEATQRKAKRLISVRLRYAINTHLEDRGRGWIVGGRRGLPLTRRQWREGDVAARLGLEMPLEGLDA